MCISHLRGAFCSLVSAGLLGTHLVSINTHLMLHSLHMHSKYKIVSSKFSLKWQQLGPGPIHLLCFALI